MKNKIEKARTAMREDLPMLLDAAFEAKFGRKVETGYNIVSMSLVTRPADEKKLTPKQYAWIEAFADGYGKAASSLARAR